MIRYRFLLQKYVRSGKTYRTYKFIHKVVFVEFSTLAKARYYIEAAYPEWETSMFWPVDSKNKPI